MNNAPIGIIDSGVGGLSVWKEISSLLPNEQTLYLADSSNAPYGAHTSKEIFTLSKKLIQFLVSKQVKGVVVACNTITVTCIDQLRKEFPRLPIIATVPAIKTAAQISEKKCIGILTTEKTTKSVYQKELIGEFAQNCRVITVGTNKLVPLIEAGDREGVEEVLRDILQPFTEANIDTLVLGCTHYPLIRDQIEREVGKSVTLIDSGKAIARHLERVLRDKSLLASKRSAVDIFYTTGSVIDANTILNRVM